jgi:hypothetical protein
MKPGAPGSILSSALLLEPIVMSRCRDGVRLSSRWTVAHAVVVPLLWLVVGSGGIGLLALAVYLDIARRGLPNDAGVCGCMDVGAGAWAVY